MCLFVLCVIIHFFLLILQLNLPFSNFLVHSNSSIKFVNRFFRCFSGNLIRKTNDKENSKTLLISSNIQRTRMNKNNRILVNQFRLCSTITNGIVTSLNIDINETR